MASTSAGRRRRLPSLEALEARSLLTSSTLLVGFQSAVPAAPVQRVLHSLRATVTTRHPGHSAEIALPPGTDLAAAARRLAVTRGVRYAEVPATIRPALVPTDPAFGSLWGLDQPSNVDIDAPQAWDLTLGRSEVIVAVIDSGVDVNHPEPAGRIWTNPGEIPGNGRDDDRNGYRDDVRGWNFITSTASVRDDDGHGTHLAGTIAANINNGTGITGVAPGIRIMPLKFIGAAGEGSIADAVEAIYYAVNKGARIINASWGGIADSPALAEAIRYAGTRGTIVVTAAGNDAANNDATPSYPASFQFPNLVSVAALSADGSLASFSSYGLRTVDLAAPGEDIRSLAPGGGYRTLSGTSMAVPHVAGALALIASREPALSATALIDRLRATAKPLPALAGRLAVPGIISAYQALLNVATTATRADTTPLPARSLHELILASDEYDAVKGGTPERYIDSLFRDLLGRPYGPGSAAQTTWAASLRAGQPRSAIARIVLNAPEAHRTQIARWFQQYLGRPTPLETLKNDLTIVLWADAIARGTSPDDILRIILASDEYYAVKGGTPERYIDGLFRDLLGRPYGPGSAAQTSWAAALRAGQPRDSVARVILTAPESHTTQIARWFQSELGRATPLETLKADPTINAWAARLVV